MSTSHVIYPCTRIGKVAALELIGMVVLGLGACSHPPKPARYIVDSGTSGWVKIMYNHPEAAELPVQNGFAVVRIPADLRIVTRSRMNPSWDGSEFYVQGPDGKLVRLYTKDDDNRRLWGMEKTADDQGEREVFFVGKQDEFTHVSRAAGDMGTGLMHAKPPDATSEMPADPAKTEPSLPK
jgi:hypothetical protein